ncbi:hypothetical protein [Streptacidiphilus sp. EB129]|uniref:hypothetical protein n=1 Tax=Streptacidiphilus sp. EB129 TaxID=3156262 RepID=UPI0035185C8D
MAARHARTRPAARTAGPCRHASAGRTSSGQPSSGQAARRQSSGHRPVRAPRCVPAAEATLLGVITTREDFELLRLDGGTEYASFAEYLCDVRELLEDLDHTDGVVRGRAFHPGDLAEFCERHGLSPADPESHAAYTADPTADVEWVRYEGETLGEFLARLIAARERGQLHRRLERLLLETAEAAPTGVFPDEPLRVAYEQGAVALRRILVGAGPGRFRLVCGIRPPEGPVEACADLVLDSVPGAEQRGEVLRIEEADLDLLCSLLCTAFALGLPGSVLLSGVCDRRGSVAWGWEFTGADFVPRNAADVLMELSGTAAAWVGVCLPGFPLERIGLE